MSEKSAAVHQTLVKYENYIHGKEGRISSMQEGTQRKCCGVVGRACVQETATGVTSCESLNNMSWLLHL